MSENKSNCEITANGNQKRRCEHQDQVYERVHPIWSGSMIMISKRGGYVVNDDMISIQKGHV